LLRPKNLCIPQRGVGYRCEAASNTAGMTDRKILAPYKKVKGLAPLLTFGRRTYKKAKFLERRTTKQSTYTMFGRRPLFIW
jgi:hypothetical protein